MKNLFYHLFIILTLCYTSCSNESFKEVVPEGTIVEPEEPENNATESCKFSISDITANSTKVINCIIDLDEQIFTLPANVKIDFDGGDIINGTLVFTGDNNTIDGRLLSSNLEVEGNVKLKDPTFKFYAVRWNIVEGRTTKEISLENRKNMNKAIETVKRLGGNIFKVNKIDAYFNVEANKVNRQYHSDRSIRIPSDFHFKMSDNTFLRVQPTHFPSYSLLTTMVKDNVIISGGNLIGDRWEHDYTPIVDIAGVSRNEHGWGFLIFIIGTHNIIVDNVTIKEAIGDGIEIHSKTIRNSDGSLTNGNRTSEDVMIKNCKIIECRRNNIAVIDANGVTIDDCDIIDTGKGEQAYDASGNKIFSKSGTPPKSGIDLEATRTRNEDGSLNELNKIENVTIKNSRFKGNAGGDVDIYTASDVTINSNYFDKAVGSFASHHVTISNNTFEARDNELTFAVSVNSRIKNGMEQNHHYTITGNTIKGYRDGIKLRGNQHVVSGNKILDCITGLHIGETLSNTEIFGNRYISNLEVSYGINPFPNAVVDNITIKNEYIEVTNRPLNLRGFNGSRTDNINRVTIDNCEFYTSTTNHPLYIKDSKNLTIKNSKMNTNLEKINSTNIIETANTIISQ